METQEVVREKHVLRVLGGMKRVPEGMSDIFPDGVLREFDGPFTRNVVDAVGLSPTQIKQMLDMRPFSQEIEDAYRDVDGRKVVDHDALFHPEEKYRLKIHTEESLKEETAWVVMKNKERMENYRKDEEAGVDVAAKYACTRKVSDYDLSPRHGPSETKE